MLFSTSLLLLVPFVFSAPLQQWSVTNNDNNNIQQNVLQTETVSSSTLNLVMHDNIQAYYENIVDEIISTRSEEVLMKLARSMYNEQSQEDLLQPQATALLGHPVKDACLSRMPGMIAQQLHRLHAQVLDAIEPTLDTLLQTYPMMITDLDDQHIPQDMDMLQYQLVRLNAAMDQHVTQILNQAHLEQKVGLQLAVCENQLVAPPRRSLWLLLKNIWLNAAKSSVDKSSMVDCNDDTNDALFVSAPSLLGSHMETMVDHLHLEFEGRLMELYTTLRSDVFDEEIVV